MDIYACTYMYIHTDKIDNVSPNIYYMLLTYHVRKDDFLIITVWLSLVDLDPKKNLSLAALQSLKRSSDLKFSSPTPQFKKHQFFGAQFSSQSNSHIHT